MSRQSAASDPLRSLKTRTSLLGVVLVFGCLLESARAQVAPGPVRIIRSSPAIRLAPSRGSIPPEILAQMQAQGITPPTGATAPGASPKADDEPKVDPKLVKAFQKLRLDRRPSTILKAWSTPEPKPVDEDPELKLPEGPPEAPKPPQPVAAATPAAATPAQPGPTGATPPKAAAGKNDPGEAKPGDQASTEQEEGAETPPTEASPEAEQAPTKSQGTESLSPLDRAFAALSKEFAEIQANAPQIAQQLFQRKQAEHKKALAAYNKKKAAIEQKRIARKIEIFSRDVTMGRWDRVKAFFDQFGDQAAKTIYPQFLGKLVAPPDPNAARNSQMRQFSEQQGYSPADVLAIIGCSPGEFAKEHIPQIPPIVALSYKLGHTKVEWIDLLKAEVKKPEDERRVDQRLAVRILAAQRYETDLGDFLPSIEQAQKDNDREALNLLARHYEAKHGKDKKPKLLEQAWQATLAALSTGEVDKKEKVIALERAVRLATEVREELGDAWLEESFTKRPERGMEIIATIGARTSKGMFQRANSPDARLDSLKLLKTSVDAVLKHAPERANGWQRSLNLLADVWLREAQHSYRYSKADSMGPRTQRDAFGNIFWVSGGYGYRSNPVQPLDPGKLLELRPDGTWREMLDPGVMPKFDTTVAQLYLKVKEEKLAFPYIEALAKTNPKVANDLAKEFLNVWIKNNDPNANRNQTNIYMFSYGFNQRASGIPLTRSKQERNLRDLAKWVEKLRGVPNIELDTKLLVKAFTASHSQAEVYRMETMINVFGSLEELDADTLASMVQGMRTNLATIWRVPALQKAAGTKRKQKDIEFEVMKGYAMAEQMLGVALSAHPDSWKLKVARAAMLHDLNNYKNRIQKASDFSGTRARALSMFAEACDTYAESLGDLATDKETVEPFDFWFQAALGASDIGAIDQNTILARQEIPKIKAKLQSIEGKTGKRHLSMFANSLFTKLSSVNPAVKNRFLEAGFDIVGDHPQARPARKVYDYYRDLIQEIQVVASVDGDADVGTEPFGVRVDLRFTKEIERESGGFAKYLQNQANGVNFYYNYGRPEENYRDKVEESLRATLKENFEIQSITFNAEDVNSKSTEEYGWRRLPYAYLLLKAKGPQVDRIPPLKVDLDFNDVTGYVVLPVVSAVVPLDASAKPEPRPFSDLSVTQILDERKAKDGRLGLEIKAEATGLVPPLEQIMKLAPADFEVDEITDQGVSVSRFGDDKDSIRSSRLWVASLEPKKGVDRPEKFAFATLNDAEGVEMLYQRYDDADLVTASATIDLLEAYRNPASALWMWIGIPVGLLALIGILWFLAKDPKQSGPVASRALPDKITPFSVIGLLRDVRDRSPNGARHSDEIDATIARLEEHYFGRGESTNGSDPDLEEIARNWLQRA